jgi:hypothetical protein
MSRRRGEKDGDWGQWGTAMGDGGRLATVPLNVNQSFSVGSGYDQGYNCIA